MTAKTGAWSAKTAPWNRSCHKRRKSGVLAPKARPLRACQNKKSGDGLRVVDANAPTIMIGEKAADMIKAEMRADCLRQTRVFAQGSAGDEAIQLSVMP
jgi:hypothetical protein